MTTKPETFEIAIDCAYNKMDELSPSGLPRHVVREMVSDALVVLNIPHPGFTPTPPITGSADGMIEEGPPKPDPRRLENRVASVEQQIAALTKRTEQHDAQLEGADLIIHQISGWLTQRFAALENSAPIPIPDDATTEPTADAGDDANKYMAVWQAARSENNAHHVHENTASCEAGKAAVAKAIKQGLVGPRIDPSDERQVRVVVEAIEEWEPSIAINYRVDNLSQSILTALRDMNGGDQ